MGDDRGAVHLLCPRTGGHSRSWPAKGTAVTALAVDPAEPRVVVGHQKGQLWVARLPGGEVEAELPAHGGRVQSIALDRAGRFLAIASLDDTVRLWTREGSGFRPVLCLPVPGHVTGVRLSPDGRFLAVLLSDERAVRVWDLPALRQRLATLGLDW